MEKIKTISQELEEIAEDMCNHYCKWPGLWDPGKEGKELCESEHCQNCPLNRL